METKRVNFVKSLRWNFMKQNRLYFSSELKTNSKRRWGNTNVQPRKLCFKTELFLNTESLLQMWSTSGNKLEKWTENILNGQTWTTNGGFCMGANFRSIYSANDLIFHRNCSSWLPVGWSCHDKRLLTSWTLRTTISV